MIAKPDYLNYQDFDRFSSGEEQMTTKLAKMAKSLPESLVRHLARRRCVLFVGSGLSAWGKLPLWSELLQIMLDKLSKEDPGKPYLEELEKLFEARKLLEVAEYCKVKLGDWRYSQILTEQLRGDNVDIPDPHKIIARLPFAALVTTNYDKLLENAYYKFSDRIPPTPTYRDTDKLGSLLFNDEFFILKAHGDIDSPKSLILTTQDYREIIHANQAFSAIFSAILLTKAILFLGYSMSDPDFRLLLDRQFTIFEGFVPDRYALMSGTSEIERDVLWRTAKIQVIPYNEHQEILTFLEALRDDYIRLTALFPNP